MIVLMLVLLILTPSNFLAATTSAVRTLSALCTDAKPPRPMIWPICYVGKATNHAIAAYVILHHL